MKWVQYTQQALMLALGAVLAIDGQITPGAMVASNALMGNALRPIGVIVQSWGQSVAARAAFARLSALLHSQPVQPLDAPAPGVTGQITLRNLEATAAGRKTPILQGLDAEFKAGEVVAIVGPSGAGKSTLARCLLGIWPGTQGDVLLDGHPIQSWPRQSLGPHLGYLPQDIELFDGSIAENIARFSNVNASVVIDAATRAGIHDMVLRLPKGYDTPIGEAGGILSGGQRQRLGLARALLGQPAVVVLDEPSANLDDAGEAALARAVRDLRARGATVFMIVHQPHLLSVADRVLVLEAGRIARLVPVGATAVPTQKTGTATA
ncbi:MAG: ATP-binding cassette domain-containing protein [Chitinophagaceae bacterium]|nr:ATP-binding cassette domain-containing protein [Rubrivivax sp.]